MCTIQSNEKTLKEQDLDLLNKSIIELVEKKTGAKIRS
jgi:phenylalanyl-tRNA synthetase beta chain